MSFVYSSCAEFADRLASKDAVPGGGGASALVGALGASLASMVGNLTVGKKKYASVEEDIKAILVKAKALKDELLTLIDKDAEAFTPLAKAYSIPKDDPQRPEIMENALKLACTVPMDIMRACNKTVLLLEELADIGSALALSDVGCGAALCKAAVQSAALSVFINTKSMEDRVYAGAVEKEADEIIESCSTTADAVYAKVLNKLR